MEDKEEEKEEVKEEEEEGEEEQEEQEEGKKEQEKEEEEEMEEEEKPSSEHSAPPLKAVPRCKGQSSTHRDLTTLSHFTDQLSYVDVIAMEMKSTESRGDHKTCSVRPWWTSSVEGGLSDELPMESCDWAEREVNRGVCDLVEVGVGKVGMWEDPGNAVAGVERRR